MNHRVMFLIGALLTPFIAVANEGMWTFDNLPSEQLKTKYDFTADKA